MHTNARAHARAKRVCVLRMHPHDSHLQHLLALRQKYGYFAQANGFKTSPSTAATQVRRQLPSACDRPVFMPSFVIQELFDDLRSKIKANASLAFADHEVESWWDATRGSGSGPRIAAGPALPVTADCNHIIFWTRQGAIISVRASGTEPKIKVHTHTHTHTHFIWGLGAGRALFAALIRALGFVCGIQNELHPGALRSYFLQHYIEFAHESSEAQAQGVCDRLKDAVLLQVFQQERFKLY
jgi:hypothetical protein